jgi:hypothetical protein
VTVRSNIVSVCGVCIGLWFLYWFMVSLFVYGLPLGNIIPVGLGFSFWFQHFHCDDVCPLGIGWSGVYSGCGIRLCGMKKKRCASHSKPGRSCG